MIALLVHSEYSKCRDCCLKALPWANVSKFGITGERWSQGGGRGCWQAKKSHLFLLSWLHVLSLSLSLLAFVCHWGRSEDDTKAEKKDKKEKKKDKKAKKASCWCLLYQLSSNDSIIFYPTCITSERQQRNWRRWRRKLLRRCGILNQQLIDTAYRAYRHCYCFPSFGQKEKKAKKEAKLLQIERAMQELQTKCPI